ncbi:MAG: PAS domain-containing sensor histidine kinase [Gammaproteobacteria bacterium]|nr:PAS domain-containing sensor histidine kinase [Gammaproteobacteria bacterium]MBU0785971.1 PAS domain-containing sensor histidine kinase [Gammaproteobacteria bacterium]MBU0816584.1 PAS domain-containing sensor histidine kinase [Gammaproteobacteria bacterium]MBU1788385.1 PAS domain-containing sensor histidine kinase [Gammaproteobacteria bacterium]
MNAHDLHVLKTPDDGDNPLWQSQLELLLESTGEGIFGIDLEGNCNFINRAGARMLGWEPSEVRGCNMHELTHHSHPDGSPYPARDCPIFNAFRQGLPCRIDTEVFWHRERHAFPVEYSSYPIMDEGQVRGAVITFVDITERRRIADALQLAKSELEIRVQERTQALSVALGQLRELAAYSEKVREDERTRIAREVHDELGSLLVALKMDVNWMDKRLGEQLQRSSQEAEDMRTRMRCKCQNMSRQIESAVDNVGRIITDLRPSILDHQGLWAALEWQAQEFVQSAELELEWQLAVDDEALALPEPLAMAVFRIFQEMLSNVGRHARAQRLKVQIAMQGGLLTLSVQDDGRGAAPQVFEAADAYGVMGMRERARHFGGRIDITSTPGEGTQMCLSVSTEPATPAVAITSGSPA